MSLQPIKRTEVSGLERAHLITFAILSLLPVFLLIRYAFWIASDNLRSVGLFRFAVAVVAVLSFRALYRLTKGYDGIRFVLFVLCVFLLLVAVPTTILFGYEEAVRRQSLFALAHPPYSAALLTLAATTAYAAYGAYALSRRHVGAFAINANSQTAGKPGLLRTIVARVVSKMLERNYSLNDAEVERAGRILQVILKMSVGIPALFCPLLIFVPVNGEIFLAAIFCVAWNAAVSYWLWSGYIVARAHFIVQAWQALMCFLAVFLIGVKGVVEYGIAGPPDIVRFAWSLLVTGMIGFAISAVMLRLLHVSALKEFLLRQRDRRIRGRRNTETTGSTPIGP